MSKHKSKRIKDYEYFTEIKLGKGSYGMVYKGIRTTDELPCAVKVIKRFDSNYALMQSTITNI